MSLLTRGINKLSQLEIDVDKDWQAREIANLKAIAAGMQHGDVIFRGAGIVERLTADAGKGYSFLRSRGPGLSPVWQDIESLVQYMTGAVNRAAAFDLAVPVPVVSRLVLQASSPPGRTTAPVLGLPTPSVSMETETGPGGGVQTQPSLDVPEPGVSAEMATGEPLGGAVADDGGTTTDETSQANNDATNDMTLLPAAPAVNDAYYFGHASPWDRLEIRIGTAGNGTWTVAWEYWNGSVWTDLPDLGDASSGFRVSGTRLVTFTRPLDWVQTTIGGIADLYWMRARVSEFTAVVTQPKGNRTFAWIKH